MLYQVPYQRAEGDGTSWKYRIRKMAKCNKKSEDDCLKCEHPKCILEMSESEYKAYKAAKKKEYYKTWYRENKVEKQAYNHEKYLSRKYGGKLPPKNRYVKYLDLRKAIMKLKKQIGEVNLNLVLDAIDQVDTEMFRHD